MPALDLSDSYARLDWMRQLGGRAHQIAVTVLERIASNPLIAEEVVENGVRYLYMSSDRTVPDELGFLVGDFAVNGRSCLDMAVQAVVNAYELNWEQPEFPLVDSVDSPPSASRSWARAQKILPAPHWEAIKGVQPYFPAAFWDIPANLTAIELRTLTNVNKHRNLTPVVARRVGWAFRPGRVEEAEAPPRLKSDALMVLSGPESLTVEEMLIEAQPSASIGLFIDGGPRCGYVLPAEVTDGDNPLVLPMDLGKFLVRTPGFVQHSLKRLEQADAWYQGDQAFPLLMNEGIHY